jgi:predicted  nucleic acid-binding Zn-ribbon protein
MSRISSHSTSSNGSHVGNAPEIVNKTGGVEVNGKMYYGLDAEIQLKQQANYDYKLEKTVWQWIEAALNEKLKGDDLGAVLKDGQVLCRLANRIQPGAIKKINAKDIALMSMENIRHYLAFCWSIGLPSTSLFTSSDLYNRRSLTEVLRNLEALGRYTQTLAGWSGPAWSGPKLAKRKEGEKSWATIEIKKPVFVQDTESPEQVDLRSEIVKLHEKLARVTNERDELTDQLEQLRASATVAAASAAATLVTDTADASKASARASDRPTGPAPTPTIAAITIRDADADEDSDGGDSRSKRGKSRSRSKSRTRSRSKERASTPTPPALPARDEEKEKLADDLAKLRDQFAALEAKHREQQEAHAALEAKYRAQQESLVKYWDQIRALTTQVEQKTAEIDRLRIQVVALSQEAAKAMEQAPMPAARPPAAVDTSKLPPAARARHQVAAGKTAAGHADDDATNRFVGKLRQCVVNLFACRVPVKGKRAPPPVDVDPNEVRRLAKILETEIGRRTFAQVLEQSTYADPETPLMNDAFEMLLFFFNTLLQQMDVNEAPDLMTASVVLHASTLIKRVSDDGKTQQFLHEYLHQYEIFANKRLWVELFWDELLAKMQNDVISSVEEEKAYVVNVDICRMLLELSIHRMVVWECKLPLVQAVIADLMEQLHFDAGVAHELQDKVVAAFAPAPSPRTGGSRVQQHAPAASASAQHAHAQPTQLKR